MSTKVEQVEKEVKTYTFQIETSLYENKDKNQKFNVYKGFIGKSLKRMTVKFTRDVNPTPTESGMITVKASDMSIDNRNKFPVLWLRGYEKIEELNSNQSTEKIDALFGEGDKDDLPF